VGVFMGLPSPTALLINSRTAEIFTIGSSPVISWENVRATSLE